MTTIAYSKNLKQNTQGGVTMKTFANKLMAICMCAAIVCTFAFADNSEKQALIDSNNRILEAERASKNQGDATNSQITEQELEEAKIRAMEAKNSSEEVIEDSNNSVQDTYDAMREAEIRKAQEYEQLMIEQKRAAEELENQNNVNDSSNNQTPII